MIGDKIREIRKTKGMTMNDLAAGAGVTPSYISQVERNVVEPSVATLQRIAQTLEMPMFAFFDEEFKEPVIVRAGNGPACSRPGSGIAYEYISPAAREAGNKIELFSIRIDPRNNDEYMQNPFEECIFIIKGSVKVFLEDVSYHLEDGDSILIKENIPYKLFNAGLKPATGISCIFSGAGS